MKKLAIFLFTIFSIHQLDAQTGIGTTTPDASAKLDVSSTNKGFLPPRVSIDSARDVTSILSPAEGLLVYNTGTPGLQAGYYYWNGANWATIATATSAGNGVTSMDLVKLYSKTYSAATGDSTIANATGYKFTVPVSGRYLFDFSSSGYLNQATMSITFKVRQGTTDLGTDIFTSANNNVHVVFTGMVEVNLQAGITYNVLVSSTGTAVTRDAGDYDRVYYKLVAGNLPVTGQSVDYIQASLSANQALSAAGNIIFNTSSGTGITITSGGFNLIANKTYKLEAAIGGTSGGYAYYAWVDNSNNLLPGGSIGAVMKAGTAYTDAPQDKAVVYFTPIVDTRVFLRVYSLSGTLTAYAPSTSSNYSSSWANISQIGSSAFVNPWTLSGTNTFNTSGNVGIGTSSPTTTLDVNGTASANTLSLSNSTIGTPSLVLKNGDAAASYSDVAQVKMGWSGSATGKSQYAQFIHSRHNSGTTGNAIDIYLSDGTADNTIATGSTKAMSIESPGNLTVAGKINLTDPSGNVVVKAAGFVNAGDYVTLGNLKATIPSGSVNKSLQLASVSGTFSVYGSGVHVFSSNLGSTTITSGSPKSISTTPVYLNSGNTFGTYGGTDTWNIMDTSNFIAWRITAIIGSGYNANFISIERLL